MTDETKPDPRDLVPRDDVGVQHSMKPLLGALVQEAVKWALADACVDPGVSLEDATRASRRRAEVVLDPFALTKEELGSMDPMALAQNVACRLLGIGGWEVGGVYGGNATAQQLVDATFARPAQDPVAELKMDLQSLFEEETDD